MTQQMYKKKKFPSNDQNKLKVVCDELCDNIEVLFQSLGIEDYKLSPKMITSKCPIHDGDNPSALNLYHTGDNYRGNWKCRTHNCEQFFKSSIIGFVRGIISKEKYNWNKDGDTMCSFKEAVDFCLDFLKKDIHDFKVSNKDKDKIAFTNIVNCIQNKEKQAPSGISRHQVKKTLEYPCKYFLERGFDSKVLDRYDVGICNKPDKPMFNRAVVPIYDNEYQFLVGCTGRSIFEKCEKCNSYHNPSNQCPSSDDSWKYSKWKHNMDFKSQNHLYNYWFAKDHIQTQRYAIVVESPGNVWRLEEAGIKNSVAIFGSSLSNNQKMILDISGAMSLILIMDQDDAGKKAAKQITEKCNRTYNVHNIDINYPDVAAMTKEQIQLELIPKIEKLSI
jgi:5S rRNA maturation endonuclease (ribonuclease M5)